MDTTDLALWAVNACLAALNGAIYAADGRPLNLGAALLSGIFSVSYPSVCGARKNRR